MTKLTARRLGSTCRVTGRSAVSGSSSRSLSTVSVWASQRHCVVGAHPHADVRGAALVAAAGAGDPAQRYARVSARAAAAGQRRLVDGLQHRVSVGGAIVDAGAVGVHGDVRHSAASTYPGVNTPYAGRRRAAR